MDRVWLVNLLWIFFLLLLLLWNRYLFPIGLVDRLSMGSRLSGSDWAGRVRGLKGKNFFEEWRFGGWMKYYFFSLFRGCLLLVSSYIVITILYSEYSSLMLVLSFIVSTNLYC